MKKTLQEWVKEICGDEIELKEGNSGAIEVFKKDISIGVVKINCSVWDVGGTREDTPQDTLNAIKELVKKHENL